MEEISGFNSILYYYKIDIIEQTNEHDNILYYLKLLFLRSIEIRKTS